MDKSINFSGFDFLPMGGNPNITDNVKFYPSIPVIVDKKSLKLLEKLVNDKSIEIYIKTPKNWKCKKKGCPTKVKHKHSTFNCLKKINAR